MRVYLILLILASLISAGGCSIGGGCKDTILGSTVSPDKESTASITTSNCGATSGFFSNVAIKTNRLPLRDAGMVFGFRGEGRIGLSWLGPFALQISCEGVCQESRIYRQVTREADYTITYVGFR
jgi:hypothetical protein